MNTLTVRQNDLNYRAKFVRPPFGLWGNGGAIIQGLFDAFQDYGVGIGSFTTPNSDRPSEQAVIVKVGSRAEYRFRFDGVEAGLSRFDDADLERFPDLLAKGAGWLRTAIPGFGFQSHLFAYKSHSSLPEGTTSEQVLLRASDRQIRGLGRNRGSGVSFHHDTGDARIDLAIDHSVSISEGIFIELIVVQVSDVIDYSAALRFGREVLTRGLAELDLRMEG